NKPTAMASATCRISRVPSNADSETRPRHVCFAPLCDVVPLIPIVRPVAGHRRENVFMPKGNAAINEIKALEDRRYQAMLEGDTAILDALCSGDPIYTHSKGDHDDKQSYLQKVGSRHFTYLEITHPADRILIVNDA